MRVWDLGLETLDRFSGCGVTLASEFWALEATVQFCPPRPVDFRILDCGFDLPHCEAFKTRQDPAIRNPKSEFLNTQSHASLVQLVQDAALPALRHRFDSGTMFQQLRNADSACGFDFLQAAQFEWRVFVFKSAIGIPHSTIGSAPVA